MLTQHGREFKTHLIDKPRSSIGESRVELDEGRAVENLSHGVLDGEDAAATHKYDLAFRVAIELGEQTVGTKRKGLSAEPARLVRIGRAQRGGARHRRVTRDDAVENAVQRKVGERQILVRQKIGRKFYQQRNASFARLDGAHVRDELGDLLRRQNVEKTTIAVGTGDIERDVVDDRLQSLKTRHQLFAAGGNVFVVGVGRDVRPQHRTNALLDAFGGSLRAVVMTTQALFDTLQPVVGKRELVDDRLVLFETKHARTLRIAAARVFRDRADFDKAEAHLAERRDGDSTLVEARCQTDRI